MTRELRMSYRVPDFEMDNDSNLPTFSRPKKTSLPEDELVELLWQNGQVVMQSQNQRSVCKSPPQDQSAAREIRPSILEDDHSALFMQEDEMTSWLNYDPSLDHNFCADVLFNTPVISPAVMAAEAAPVELRSSVTVAMGRPPIPPGGRRIETSNSKAGVRESTVVDSSDTPSVGPDSRVSEMAVRKIAAGLDGDVQCEIISGGGGGEVAGGVTVGGDGVAEKENMICEMTVPSSPDGSIASAEPAAPKPVADDRKRKGRALDDNECQSEDIEYESVDAKKQLRGSTSTKRSRAAEVHNLSERVRNFISTIVLYACKKVLLLWCGYFPSGGEILQHMQRRRDRINEKMKALQELIPRCNKTDKASMLDEAIEYLKALQLQVQMMSMGCGMVPMMFSGVQQYMPPPMGMGIGMGMGMGMEMGMNRPMMQFPSLLAGSTLPMQAGAGHLGPRFPLPNFAMHPGAVSDPSRTQTSNQAEQMLNSISTLNTSHPNVSGLLDSYQQFLSSNHMHFSITQASPQNQPLVQSNTSRPCTSKGPENLENHQPG